MLPKIIHQIWVGPDDPPIDWMQTWVDFAHNAGWEYRVWAEHTIPPLENWKAYNYYYETGKFYGASDVARVEILERFGGWFMDADMQLINPIGFASDPMQTADFVVSEHLYHVGRYPNGIIGSVTGHEILSRYVEMISQLEKEDTLEPAWATVGGTALFRAVKQIGGATIIPMRTFLPFNFGEKVPGDDPVYAIHHQYSTRKVKEFPPYSL